MATRVIAIMKGYPDGKLKLSDRGHTIAKRGDTILWQIDPDSEVDCIISIQEKSGSTNIFPIPPHAQGNNWTGDISSTVPDCTIYVYSITWSNGSVTHVFDPIISIKPSKISLIEPSKFSLIVLVTFVLGLFGTSLLFWRKKKSSK
jgi:hypothetical protein